MHTDHEVLEALRTRFDEQRLAALLGRLLRVPEAWSALHNPAFLDEVISNEPPTHLTPSHLAGLALGGELAGRLSTDLLDPYRRRARDLWQNAEQGRLGHVDLFDVALLGLMFASQTEQEGSSQQALNSLQVWRSPLSVAWPALPDPEAFLAQLIDAGELRLAVHLALANLQVDEAASYLMRNANGSTVPVLLAIFRSGETGLIQSLEDPRIAESNHAEPFSAVLLDAVGARDSDQLQSVLHDAWQNASSATAFIADLTAELAASEAESDREYEANRHALELSPSSERRARTALSLAKLDRVDEALELLSASASDAPMVEKIAAAVIRTDSLETLNNLRAALAEANAAAELSGSWFETLDRLFRQADDVESVIRVAQTYVTSYPASAEAHLQLAHALREAGDQTASLAHSELAQSLEPSSQPALRMLAKSLEASGDYRSALERYQLLEDTPPETLGICALASGDYDQAGAVVEQMLLEDPRSVEAHVLLGQILAAKEQDGSARAAFEEAIKLGPNTSAAYIALADFQSKLGEPEAAGLTLRAATMAYPADSAAQSALAASLRIEQRHSEALEAAAQASALEPLNTEYSIAHAELLLELGHTEKAIEALNVSAERVPRDWRIRFALAKAHEQKGELDRAGDLAGWLPDAADPQDHLIAGRIGVKAGKDLAQATESLKIAEQQGLAEPSLHYWYGEALEKQGYFEEAFDRYSRLHRQPGESGPGLHEQALLGMARAALGQDQISLALSSLDDAREQFGDSAKLLAMSSRVYQAAKLTDKALEMAERAVELDRTDPEGWRALGGALAGSGDFVGAMSAIKRLSSLDPTATEGWIQLARMAGGAGELATARKAVAEAIWNGRKEAKVLAQAAEALADIGALNSAVRLLEGAVRKRPNDPAFLQAVAALHARTGNEQLALEAWVRSAKIAKQDANAWIAAAECAKRLGKSQTRIEYLERALSVDPGNSQVQNQLAIAYLELGYKQRGVAALIDALQVSPNDASLATESAEIALQAGAVREALGMIGKAQQLASDPGRTQAALAESFILLQEWDKAESALAEAIENDQVDARVLAMLAIVRSHQSDRLRSEESLAQAEAATAKTAHQAIWLARAQARHFKTDQALATVAAWERNGFAAVEKVRMMLRATDAHWLFKQADALQRFSSTKDIESAIAALEDAEIADTQLAPLRAWHTASQEPEQLTHLIAGDSSGQLGEAAVIALLQQGEIEQALESVRQTREACGAPEWLAVLEGLCHEKAGHLEQARAAWSRASGPISPLAEYLSGRSYARIKSYERASRRMEAAVAAWPDQPAWQHALADIYSQLSRRDQALAHYQQASVSAPENSVYQLSFADALRLAGRHAQAEEPYEMALGNGSATSEAYRDAAANASALGMHAKALERYEQAIGMAPSDPVVRIGAARAAQEAGDSRAANGHLRIALELGSDLPEVLLGHGQMLTQAGDTRAAIRAFDQALQAGADPARVHRNQSKLYLRRGDSERAVKALHQAIEVQPEDDRLWHDLAITFESQGDMTAADEAVCEAIKLSPLNPDYRLTLARLSRRAGNLDRAIEELHQGRERSPADPRFPVEIGLVHEDRREYSRALDAYREAIEMDSDCLEAYYRAGLLLRTLKAYRRAGEMLKHAAELAPINKDVLHQLAAVRALELVHG